MGACLCVCVLCVCVWLCARVQDSVGLSFLEEEEACRAKVVVAWSL